MAEEKFFSVEETLLDILGFAKKLSITIIDNICRPWRLVITTHLIVDKGKAYKEPGEEIEVGRKYISHFLYFVICLLIFLSYYKGLLFNNYNQLSQPMEEVIRNTNTYLTETSVIEKLLLYFPVIALAYIVITIAAYLIRKVLVSYLSIADERKAQFFFKRTVYFNLGTLLLLLILPIYFRGKISNSEETYLTYGIIALYFLYTFLTLCFPIHNRAVDKPVGFSFDYVKKVFKHLRVFKGWQVSLLVIVSSLLANEFLLKPIFNWEVKSLGYLDYSSVIKAEPLNRESTWGLRSISATDSSYVTLSTEIVLTNRWDRGVVVKEDSILMIQFTKQMSADPFVSFKITNTDSTTNGITQIDAGETKYFKLVSEPITNKAYTRILNSLTSSKRGDRNANYYINCYPVNSYERARRTKIECRIESH